MEVMAHDGNCRSKYETGCNADEDALAEDELVELGTEACEHHGDNQERV